MSALAADTHNQTQTVSEKAALIRNANIHKLPDSFEHSYSVLEDRIGQLQEQLAESNQARLKESSAKEKLAERLDLILGVMPAAVILLDGRGVVVQANAMAEALLGYVLQGMRWLDVIQKYFAPTPVDGHEVVLRNGRLVSLATQSLTNEPGQIIVLTDLTETRRLQENLNHHRKLSEMGRMTASLAHQIRTPLSSAILFADHIANPELPETKKQHYADRIRTQLSQLDQHVRDMLIFSQGGVVLDQVISVEQLIQRFQLQLKDICGLHNADFDCSQNAVKGAVRCNQELLVSAFNNLVVNAVQACRAEKIAPYLTLTVSKTRDAVLEIVLNDNGPGIGKEIEQKILEPFFTTKSTGTGLGLAVVNAIIQSHGGNFSISSLAGQGAEATLTLPLVQQN